ncbi:unnamed protein product, partial [Mesorhabditis spiculigera]
MPGFFGTGGASTFGTPPPQEPPAKSDCVRGLRKALEKYNLLESRICTCRARGRCTVCAWRRWEGHAYEDPALRED